jgi:hypothetical protein
MQPHLVARIFMAQPVCRGHQCTSTDLIEAHIVARGFARDAQENYPHNLLVSAVNRQHQQTRRRITRTATGEQWNA